MNETKMLEVYLSASELLQAAAVWLASDGRILGVNTLFSKELGYSQEALKGKSIFQINPHINLMDWKKIWKSLEATGSSDIESDHITADGKLYPIKMTAVMVDIGEEKVCIGIVKNLLELTRYKDMLELVTSMTKIGSYELDLVADELITTKEFYRVLEMDEATQPLSRECFRALIKAQISPDELSNLDEITDTAIRDGVPVETEFAVIGKNGIDKHLRFYVYPLTKEGVTYKIYGAIQDITQQKATAQPLELTKYLIDNASEMIYWVKEDGRIRYSNQAFFSRMGYTEEEITQLHIVDLVPDVLEIGWDNVFALIKENKTLVLERNKQCKDGSLFPAQVFANFVEFHGDAFICKYVRDLSEIRQAESELRRAFDEISALKGRLELENSYLQSEIEVEYNFNNIVTTSESYKSVLQQVHKVANTDATVLITGETGTGKELLARAIHSNSNRGKRQMIKVNCAALPENLIESELFGHEKGAFTGAIQRKPGRFELAHRSTIFLDEIGEMPLELQTKLLRVLQEGEFERVGGSETLHCDVRVIAATNRNLEQMVQEGKFRQDLYYRISVFPIHNIPLRERKEDIALLIRHFVKKFSIKTGKNIDKIPRRAFEILEEYSFPGNIRELENIIERSVILSHQDVLNFDAIPFKAKEKIHLEGNGNGHFKSLEEIQREHILNALKKTQGRVSGPAGAARLLGLNDKTLFSKMAKLGIHE
ncbi:sigma 54-interacting transcriptional regulator [Haliscomenobacter sp.]|uniref:sigma 54-interacting transcriptional regulator n=1 Tax=Haliscomenobacter sp. TaxID=2717303 RepID=UPI0035936B92